MIKCDVMEPKEQTIACYLGGLKIEISNVVQLHRYWTLADVCKLESKVEKQQKEFKGKGISPRPPKLNNISQPGQSTAPSSSGPPKLSHPITQPKVGSTNQPRSTTLGSRKCFKCQGYDHIIADCPNRKIVTLIEVDIEETAIKGEITSSDHEEVICADEGELLVCRNLSVQREEHEDWLRHNIFRIKCTTQSKVCDVIIHGGSFENIVSADMVNKLKLKTEEHPHPHGLTWLNKKK